VNNKPDFWPKEREGYADNLRPAYATVQFTPSPRRWVTCRTEERLGSLLAGAGLCWAAWVLTHSFGAVSRVGIWPPGPLEVCATGVLVWMHAKWRRRFAK
jgi:hypothetical protein